MQFTDTHCHIHEAEGDDPVAEKWHKAGITRSDPLVAQAQAAGVTRMICVGCTVEDSKLAVDFAPKHEGVSVSIGIHPHEAQRYVGQQQLLDEFAALATRPKVVAVG